MEKSATGSAIGQRRARLGASVALLVLALMQISIAGHDFAHSADNLSTNCETCIQQDRLDDLFVATDQPAVSPIQGSSFSSGIRELTPSYTLIELTARGPPIA